jgi:hypothetical protein
VSLNSSTPGSDNPSSAIAISSKSLIPTSETLQSGRGLRSSRNARLM